MNGGKLHLSQHGRRTDATRGTGWSVKPVAGGPAHPGAHSEKTVEVNALNCPTATCAAD